jgi:dihydrofolate reductase
VAVIGGAIFRLFLPLATRVELTEVHADVAGDTVMPPLAPNGGSLRARHTRPKRDARRSLS